jgi:hypothetical protein
MYNYYRQPWLIDRLGHTLELAYGHRPCADSTNRGNNRFSLLVVGLAAGSVACSTTWVPGAEAIPEPARDDYPFLYLRDRSIPQLYLVAIVAVLITSLALVRAAAGPLQQMRGYLDLFFMGAAFLLLETKNVVQFALLFGTTWLVNALVFAAILLSVYAAVEVTRRFDRWDSRFTYVALFVSLASAWAAEPERLLQLAPALRLIDAAVFAFTPVFVANLIFAQRFRLAGSSTVAFGANLLGAMVGGLLEYGSLVVGYRSLLLLVAALYAAALVSARKSAAQPQGTGSNADDCSAESSIGRELQKELLIMSWRASEHQTVVGDSVREHP